MAKKKTKSATKNRRADRMHMRSVGELQAICTYIDTVVEKVEEREREDFKAPGEEHEKTLREKDNLSPAELQERLDAVKRMQEANREKYAGKWFTNTVNALGKIDLNGDYKKIRVADFKKLMLDAEEQWAKANKEKPLGGNQLTSDLKRCGVITTGNAKTHRPVDPYGDRVSDENMNQVMEFCVSQLKFFSNRGEGGQP